MKHLLLLLSLAACTNDAITYAKAVYPEASCNAITTDTTNNDSAVCTVGRDVYRCTDRGCDQVRTLPEPLPVPLCKPVESEDLCVVAATMCALKGVVLP